MRAPSRFRTSTTPAWRPPSRAGPGGCQGGRGGGTAGVIWCLGGKAWQWPRPGGGGGAGRPPAAAAAAAGAAPAPNMVQRAFYNGNYGFHGAKVSHLFQLDGMIYCTVDSIRDHDSKCFSKSALWAQVHGVWITGVRQAICLADAAYRETTHIKSTKTRAQLAAMTLANRARAKKVAAADNPLRTQAEHSFNKVMRLNGINDAQTKFQVFRNGGNAWNYTSSIWPVQVLFANLHTCLYQSDMNGYTGIEAPTVEAYLASANRGRYQHVQ